MTSLKTIAFLYPGAMGAGLAQSLHARQPSLRLITSHGSRSADTAKRAAEAGLINVPFPQLVHEADVIVSILPPSAAVTLAREVVSQLESAKAKVGASTNGDSAAPRTTPLIYIDANAIAPQTVSEIASILAPYGIPFIDGCVIGLPPSPTSNPKIYLSAADAWSAQLAEVAAVLSGGGEGKGLDIRVMEDAGEGAASALKMCYGGINKGYVGLASLLVLTANAHSPATAQALLKELSLSKPASLLNLTRSIPDSIDKAYRWVGEMEEIGSFISTALNVPSSADATASDHRNVADTYAGLAQVFQRVADANRAAAAQKAAALEAAPPKSDDKDAAAVTEELQKLKLGKGRFDQSTHLGDPEEVDVLYGWAKSAKQRLEEIGYSK